MTTQDSAVGSNAGGTPADAATTHYATMIQSAPAFQKNNNNDNEDRFVVVRYYLDRPGYDMDHSSARIWKNPPLICAASDIALFLTSQGIDTDSLLVEVYLDKFHSYMLLEACETGGIVFDFSLHNNHEHPGVLNIRLTDNSSMDNNKSLLADSSGAATTVVQARSANCNTSQIGLFAFSLTVALETTELTGRLVGGGRIEEGFVLTWGPYAFFVSGLLQLIVGQWEVTRNNVYGATAFMAFGSFWLANGLKLILTSYFPEQIPPEFLEGSDPWGNMIRNLYILAFVCVLFKQTLVLNRLSTILISLLCIMQLGASFAGFSTGMQWLQMIMGWITSAWAFYVFTAEFTNEVYHREVFKLYPWNEASSDEVFGRAGRANNLTTRAAKLRSAAGSNHNSMTGSNSKEDKYTFHQVRSVMPDKHSVTPEDKSK